MKSFIQTRAKAQAEESEEEMGDHSGGLSGNHKGTEQEDDGKNSPIPKKVGSFPFYCFFIYMLALTTNLSA